MSRRSQVGLSAKTRRPGITTDYGRQRDSIHQGFSLSQWAADGKKWAHNGWKNR